MPTSPPTTDAPTPETTPPENTNAPQPTTTPPAAADRLAAFQRYYDALNPEQREAVDNIEGPVMVIAGAGTGKTQILAVRIAKILLETQIDPFNILCLTFTDAGVTAMRSRLIEIVGTAAYHVKVCTFHSFCNEIIRDNPDTFIFKQQGEQLDDLERVELLEKIIDRLGVTSPLRPTAEPYTFLKDLGTQIQNLKKENIDPETLSARLDELETLLTALRDNLNDLLEAKRTFPADICALADPVTLFPRLKIEPTPFQQHYLDYLSTLHGNYLGELCGEKRKDNSAGKKLRDALRKLILDGLDHLPKQRELARAYTFYREDLTETGRYDYEDMIMMAVRELENSPALLRKYQEIYQYILVDEYQDTNSAQNRAVDLLGNFFESPNIFVVGDDDQSIYRFQGASIENIINFYRHYAAELKLVTLIRNYRSQQTILDAAGQMVARNRTRIAGHLHNIDKNLQSHAGHAAAAVKLYRYSTEQAEIYGTAKKIESLIAAGTDPAQIAVLYHRHAEAEELTELLLKLGIPFELRAGQNILQDLQIGKLLALFRLIENPNDDEAFCQTLFLDFLGFDKLDVLKFANFFNQRDLRRRENHSWLTALGNETILQSAQLSQPRRLREFVTKVQNWREAAANQTLPEFFVHILEESGFIAYQVRDGNSSRLEVLNRLNSLYKEIKKQTRRNHALTITEFLAQLNTRRAHDLKLVEEPLHIGKSAVQLMTAHGAKGLEFEEVFLIRATSRSWDKIGRSDKIRLPAGLVKSLIADEKMELEEDNRRLFYVAMTRAKKELHLSYARQRFENGKGREDIPTIYLNEIPPEHLEEIDTAPLEENLPDYLDTLFMGRPAPDLTARETEHFRALAERIVLSPTSLNTYLTCPRRFFYQTLIRLPQAKSAAQGMGTAVHKALELFLNQYRKTKINPGREFLLLHYQKALQKEMLTDKDYQERLEYGRNLISEYFDARGHLLTSDTFSEINFSSHGVNLDGIPITGKIDKVSFGSGDPDGPQQGLTVSDFKTGNADRQMSESRHGGDYWRQMVFYKILADNSPRFKKDFQNRPVRVSQLEFLEKSRKSGEYLTAAIEVTPEAVAEVTENIRFVHGQIRALAFDKIDRSEPCDRCPFKNICWEK